MKNFKSQERKWITVITNSNRMRSKVDSGSFEENGKFSLILNPSKVKSDKFLL